jgi:predicted small secreted protein
MKKTIAILALLAALPILSACNTTAGAGQDIKQGGQAIENSAIKHSPSTP